jgi:RNA polymerase sporulation-specific sigma factor
MPAARKGRVLVTAGLAVRASLDLTDLSDEDLVERQRQGDTVALETLLNKYRNFTRMKARSYFLIGADKDDIVQEGMIGLYKAIRDFNPERLTSFRAFAEICITRQIITAIKTATRQKHIPLNSYVSLSKPLAADDDQDRSLADVLHTANVTDPAELLISSEEMKSIKMCFNEILSDFEADVLHLYVEGKSYQEISVHLGRHVKSVDNALQRIKRKVELHIRQRSGDED